MEFEIDKDLVQKIINEEISPNYVINNIIDTEKYIFIGYKHRYYDRDDDRATLVGVGDVIYDKEKSEYKLLGSGDYITGDYLDYLQNETEEEEEIEIKSLDQIITRIKERQYVNRDDYHIFLDSIKKEHSEFKKGITMDRNLNLSEHFLFESENNIIQNKIIAFWKLFGYPYHPRNNNQIILCRTEKSCC
ncbi:hypothetical protein SGQ83_11400 [Flavobacterium sp. Fl-318]|uniref:Immunity protein 35 domain-containing protein n=1 Tax=Flavobacterium cupriresistens TaxID=2893885 RepID=A0ABU4RCG0_9FLAO|nr:MULTISPECIES: hypothetical protein [unclassified Flavobacterium]MDX6189956.1 hypothetical protein [Flavobacterium sp. Fl-318]UFH42781.1 hypothetical protein LNP23_00850 [Flavobacterium sp. F-323]